MIFGARSTSSPVSNSGAMSSGTDSPFAPRWPHFASTSTDSTSSGPCAMLTMYGPIDSRPYFRRQCAIVWNTASVRRPSDDIAPTGDSRRSRASSRRRARCSSSAASQFGSWSDSPITRRCTSAFWRMSTVAK